MAQPEQPRGILQITGSDRVSFLQNLVTNEIDALGLHYAALLNPQGKYIADFFVLVRQNDILIDVAKVLQENLNDNDFGILKNRINTAISLVDTIEITNKYF